MYKDFMRTIFVCVVFPILGKNHLGSILNDKNNIISYALHPIRYTTPTQN
jgi:hypothetical protein